MCASRTRRSRENRGQPLVRTTSSSASTQTGSNWVPEQRSISSVAWSTVRRPPVDAVLGHGVEGVADGDHPRSHRDLLARSALPGSRCRHTARGSTGHQWHQVGEVGHGLEDPGADLAGAPASPPHSSSSSSPGLAQDLLGDADLADVVQQRPEADDPRIRGRDAELLADGAGQIGDLAGVVVGVGVLGLQRRGQGCRGSRSRRPRSAPACGRATPSRRPRAPAPGTAAPRPRRTRAGGRRRSRSARTALTSTGSDSISSDRNPSSTSNRASVGSTSAPEDCRRRAVPLISTRQVRGYSPSPMLRRWCPQE